MKILHLIIDHQVIERNLKKFERLFPQCNDVMVFIYSSNLKHLKEYVSCPHVSKRNARQIGKCFDFSSYKYIVAHYLTPEMIDFIGYAPSYIHVCWDIYGADLYDQFLAPMGFRLQFSDSSQFASLPTRILKKIGLLDLILFVWFRNKMRIGFIREKYFSEITCRLNSIEVGCIGDARLLEKYSGKNYTVYRVFNYSLKETLGDLYGSPYSKGNGILVGNSASLSNNHLYVLEYLSKIDIGNSEIIMSLSYGGNPRYRKEIVANYNKQFPGKINCLLNYMPLSEYNRLFLKLKAMVMAAWRQESIGTIVMGLYLGLKIYMSNKSPLYLSLKEEGFFLYTIEDVDNNDFVLPLTIEEQQHNRNLLLELYNEDLFDIELRKQFV